jgi:hypothetical protein
MSWATIVLLLTCNISMVVLHAKMAAPGLTNLSIAADISAWVFCVLMQVSSGSKK